MMPNGVELVTGLLCGLVGLGLVGLVVAVRRRPDARPLPWAASLVAAATLLALHGVDRLPPWLVGGALAILVGSGLGSVLRVRAGLWPLLLAPGGGTIAWLAFDGPLWARLVVLVAVTVGGALAAEFQKGHTRAGTGSLLLLVSAAGIFGTVPDTEHALVLLGATVPLAIAGWPLRWTTPGRIDLPVWVAVAVWTGATGGMGRNTSIVGGVGSLGLLVLEPIVRRVSGRRRPVGGAGTPPPLEELILHLVLVVVASRVAGLSTSILVAVAVVAVANSAVAWFLTVHSPMFGPTVIRRPREPT